MARPLRIEFPGAVYHLTARGNERRPIYRTDSDRRHFLAVLADVAAQYRLLVHAYVLMDNHYHILAETLEANLARAMRRLNGVYAQQFNRTHRRVGHLFQARYKALLVDRDTYLVELSRYIHLNPVRAGLVGRAQDYAWSSSSAYVGRLPTPPAFLTLAEILGHFAPSTPCAQVRYQAFLQEAEEGRAGSAPLERVVGQMLLGAPDWVAAVRQHLAAPAHHGSRRLAHDLEVPAARQLQLRPQLDQIIAAVGDILAVDPAIIRSHHSRHLGRAVAMYLAYTTGGLLQQEISAAFGVQRYAVSKAAAAVRRTAERNVRLRRLINSIRSRLAQ